MYDQHTAEAPPSAPASPGTPPTHEPYTVERGSFCIARCDCGWTGPARRSRDRARTDAEEHRSAF
ncbi:hypothetical protein ABZS81_16235 [Streptomyces sp. NPDC005318]|uniref:hypothetical protein n=1 Tax=unclassified Streptomyces TaxID=2593676 RepID=UPI002E28171D|nr:hypothetical protein [Streptomyces sp. NBC_00316]